jgi:hypothetical protein
MKINTEHQRIIREMKEIAKAKIRNWCHVNNYSIMYKRPLTCTSSMVNLLSAPRILNPHSTVELITFPNFSGCTIRLTTAFLVALSILLQ